MNYQEALTYIHSVSWEFCKPGLERITTLTDKLARPQDKLKFIHVAGTNGKGSLCSMLDSILRAAGLKVGLFTSPYIKVFNERMCIDGTPIADEELAEITSYVRPIADSMKDKPTEFELITAIALEYFSRNNVDIVIFEAGMGGRLDSTNVITTPVLSIITGIALDHTAFLGDTTEKIAYEKAGIIKEGIPVLYGGDDADALKVIENTAKEKNAPLFTTDRTRLSIKKSDLSSTLFDYGEYKDLEIKLLGLYQPNNAANVLTAVEILKSIGYIIDEEHIRAGLLSSVWHARYELLSTDPVIIYDGAHNPEGIEMFVKSTKTYFPDTKVILVSTVMGDKDYENMVEKLCEVCRCAYLFKVNDRALDCGDYAEVYRRHGGEAYECENMKDAIKKALDRAQKDGIPLIFAGSLYMYESVTRELDKLR